MIGFDYAPNYFSTNEGKHIGCFYKSFKEQMDIVCGFIKTGIQKNEKCVYITSVNTAEQVVKAFAEKGIDASGALKSGQLSVSGYRETYLRGGGFDMEGMLNSIKPALLKAEQEGYSGLRTTGEMGWALNGYLTQLMEYEMKCNDFISRAGNRFTALCQYDFKKFPEDTIKDMILIHPFVMHA